MCLIIYKPATTNAMIPSSYIRNAAEGNDDGFGLMWSDGFNLHIERTMDPDSRRHVEMIDTVPEGVPLIMHWRFGTHGTKSLNTCHPFPVTPDIYLAHNGVLSIDTSSDRGLTDTQHFINAILRPELISDPDQYGTPEFAETIGHLIGGSKFAMLRSDGKVMLVNEQEGTWRDDLWYSNSCGFYSPAKYWTTSYKSYSRPQQPRKLVEVFDPAGNAHNAWDEPEPLTDADKYTDLSDLTPLSEDEIAALCFREPALIAALVFEHLQYELYCDGGYDGDGPGDPGEEPPESCEGYAG